MKPEQPVKPDQSVREPKQSRSRSKKEKILNTAFTLFCEKGYYNTTTNEIARIAGVSIGTLYSYFTDKDKILLEILDRFNQRFTEAKEEALSNQALFESDKKAWFRILIEALIKAHETSIELIKELNVLYYANPQVAAILDEQRARTREVTLEYFLRHQEDLKVEDVEATAIITFDFISAIVDRVVFGNDGIDRDRIINTGIDALYKALVQ